MSTFVRNGVLFIIGPDSRILLTMPWNDAIRLLSKDVNQRIKIGDSKK